jgi:hypothetical protein
MTKSDAQKLLNLLWESVEKLSQPAETQVAWLRAQDLANANELALEFDDAYPAVAQLAPARLSENSAHLLARIDTILETLSKDPTRWELPALANDPAWQEARDIATDILAEVRRAA